MPLLAAARTPSLQQDLKNEDRGSILLGEKKRISFCLCYCHKKKKQYRLNNSLQSKNFTMFTRPFSNTLVRHVSKNAWRSMASQASSAGGGGGAWSSGAGGSHYQQAKSKSWGMTTGLGAALGAAFLFSAPQFTPPKISHNEKGHCMHCPEPLDDEDEKDQKAKDDDEQKVLSSSSSSTPGSSPDEDDYLMIPPYVASHFKEDLGGALNRNPTRISEEAKLGLASEAVYPIHKAEVTLAPNVPPPIKRNHPVHLVVDMVTTNKQMNIVGNTKYEYWPFGYYDYLERKNKYGIPGPFIRARVGDVLQVNFTNLDESGMAHSIDFHAVCGPGGGSPTNFAEQDETKVGAYLLQKPGLYVYHCAAAPIPVHIHNGMFGLILVEPPEGLPEVDKEIYVMQHELYVQKSDDDPKVYEMDYVGAENETPKHVLFNGREGALVEKPVVVKQNETVRIYFGNGGPNLVSSFHVIGAIFDKVWREGDLLSPPARSVQTTLVPAGGAVVVDMKMEIPGSFSIVDHSIFRIDKGAVGMIKVKGTPRPDIYDSLEPPVYCPGCKTHQ